MVDYAKTIAQLRGSNLVAADEYVVVSVDAPDATAGVLFGAIGAAAAAAKCAYYLLAVNENELKFFDIDKKTGEYLGTVTKISKNQITRAKVGLGNSLVVFSDLGVMRYTLPKKVKGYAQKEEVKKVVALIKTAYPQKK